MVAQTATFPLSGLLMLKSAWIPFLLGTPLFLIGTAVLLLLPPDKRAKASESDTTTSEDSQRKVQSTGERMIASLKGSYDLVRDNLAAFIFVGTWILAILPGHPFLLIFLAKKFTTSFSAVSSRFSPQSISVH